MGRNRAQLCRDIDIADTSRVYFLGPANGDCAGPTGLLRAQRANRAPTTPIDPGMNHALILFVRATPNGQAAYFVTSSKFEFPPTRTSPLDLYRYDEQTAGIELPDVRALPATQACGTPLPVGGPSRSSCLR